MKRNKQIIFLTAIVLIALAIYMLSDNREDNSKEMEENIVNEIVEVIAPEQSKEVTTEEKTEVQEYLDKIYSYFEMTLPEFEDINKANESWLWGVSLENVYDYETGNGISYETLNNFAKTLFGNSLTRALPKKNMEFIEYDENTNTYRVSPRGGVMGILGIVVVSAEKTEACFIVKTVEYFEEVGWDDSRNLESLAKQKIQYALNNQADHNPKTIILTQDTKGELHIQSSKND